MTLNSLLILKHLDIVIHLLDRGQNDRLAFLIKLRATCTTKNLLNIKHSEVLIRTSRRVINLRSFNNNTVSRQIDSPR
jgi:hypothetical protein